MVGWGGQTSFSKVIGGIEAAFDRYPYAVLIENTLLCSGALIAPNVVLTSATCVDKFEVDVTTTAYINCFNAGNEDLRSSCIEQFEVINTIIHPNFESFGFSENDLSLLVLSQDSTIQPVRLVNNTNNITNGYEVKTIGWGPPILEAIFNNYNYNDFLQSNVLLETNLTFLDRKTCVNQLNLIQKAVNFTFIEPLDIFCTIGNINGVCSLTADDGTGFYITCDDNPNNDILIGILGLSSGCGSNGVPIVVQSLDLNFIKNEVENLGKNISIFQFIEGQNNCKNTIKPSLPTPFPTFIENKWTCSSNIFNALDGCDCDCGIPDPDCEVQPNIMFCGENSNRVDFDFICIEAKCLEWTCGFETYNDSKICNCGCGTPDPDCKVTPSLPIVGCGDTLTCLNDLCEASPDSEVDFVLLTTSNYFIFGGICIILVLCGVSYFKLIITKNLLEYGSEFDSTFGNNKVELVKKTSKVQNFMESVEY